MGERPKNRRSVKSFDLLENPFSVLGIEPSASLEKIADAFDDALTDRTAPESDLAAAREAVAGNPTLPHHLAQVLDVHVAALRKKLLVTGILAAVVIVAV